MSEQSQEAGLEGQFYLENQSDGSKTPIEAEIKVGRDPGCELVLTCEKCSRVHAEMRLDDGALWVQDRKSTNGTFVNNREISENTRLADGDVVQFGDSRFRVVAPESPEPEVDDMRTVVASRDSLLRMLDDEKQADQADAEGAEAGKSDDSGDSGEAAEPAKSSKSKKSEPSEPSEPSEKASKPGEPEDSSRADQSPDSSGTPGSKASSRAASESRSDARDHSETVSGESAKPVSPEKPEAAPKPKEKDVPPAGVGAQDNPSIPRSWADADQLEQRSHTAVFVRGSDDAIDTGSDALHPLKAIAQARLNTPADLAILVGLTEPVRGTLFKLSRKGDTNKWEIGRGEGADISIDDDSVSGRHAQLIYERGRWKVVNMMSVNGTFVNGRKILSAYLNARDVIRAGGVELVFDARIEKSGSKPRSKEKSTGASSGAGNAFTAPFRWMSRQWKRLVSRFRG